MARPEHSPPQLPPPAALEGLLEQDFTASTLYALRSAVAAHAAELGISPASMGILLVSANELAANAITHAGGAGRLRLWAAQGRLYCQIQDHGPGLRSPASAGQTRPPIPATSGRGLWIVHQLAGPLAIASTSAGTTITISFPL
jgi:anti-sigma regulatory factor (Ser/Thr protein kinase)